MVPRFWFCEVYRVNFYYFIGWKGRCFERYALEEFNHETDCSESRGKYLLVEKNNATINCIWIRKKKDYPALAHESVHAALSVFDYIGQKVDSEYDESFCYLVEAIIRKGLNK